MIKEIVPHKVSIKTTKKDGTMFKNGSALIGLCFKDKTGADFWINGFGQASDAPQENTPITIDIYEDEYNGAKQWKFKFLSAEAVLSPKLKAIEDRLTALEVKVNIG